MQPEENGSAAGTDALGEDGRRELLLQMLAHIQAQLFKLDMEVTMNELGPDDRPPMHPSSTVAEYRAFLEAAELRLTRRYAALLPDEDA